jgi:hypothetical protein
MSMDSKNQAITPLPSIVKMDKEIAMKLNAQAVKNQQEVTLKNGLVLNQNNTGKMTVNLKVMSKFERN